MRKKGRLILSLPNIESLGFLLGKQDWFHLDTPRHLLGFTRETIVKMLENCGFRILTVKYFAFENPFDVYETISFRFKLFKNNYMLKSLFLLPLLLATLILKMVSALFKRSETIQVVAYKP